MATSGSLARIVCLAALASGFLLTVRAPAAVPTPTPAALDAVQPGLWELAAEGAARRAMCVIDPVALIQVRHGAAACSRIVIADGHAGTTVHYSCPGAGWGRTSLHIETPRSVRIETQGIAAGAPFAFTARARRTGDCGGVQRTAFH